MIVVNLLLPYPAPPTHFSPSSASKPSLHLHVLSLLIYYCYIHICIYTYETLWIHLLLLVCMYAYMYVHAFRIDYFVLDNILESLYQRKPNSLSLCNHSFFYSSLSRDESSCDFCPSTFVCQLSMFRSFSLLHC